MVLASNFPSPLRLYFLNNHQCNPLPVAHPPTSCPPRPQLDVVDFDDIKSGFKVVLTFAPNNTHFSDRTLVKAFHYGDDGKVTIEPAVIHWNEGYVSAHAGRAGGRAAGCRGRGRRE